MKLADYQNLALQTESPIKDITNRHQKQPYSTSLTEFRVLHASLGLITEIYEFVNHESEYNLREELGDLFWFLALGYTALEKPFKPRTTIKLPSGKLNKRKLEAQALKDMTEAAVTCLDWCKARTFYNRVKKKEKTFESVIATQFAIIHKNVVLIATIHNLDVRKILEENIAKLQARYPEKYSDKSANTRDYQKEQTAAENLKRGK